MSRRGGIPAVHGREEVNVSPRTRAKRRGRTKRRYRCQSPILVTRVPRKRRRGLFGRKRKPTRRATVAATGAPPPTDGDGARCVNSSRPRPVRP